MEMKNILLRIESRLDDLTKAFHQLKTENEILRKEILGVSSSENSDGMGLMETRTLREIIEETEFYVNRINSCILREETEIENPERSKPRGMVKTNVSEESDSKSLQDISKEFPIVEIRSKTLADEREILKETFKKLIKEKKVIDGASLHGTSVQTISNSMPRPSCTMKLSNFLESSLTDLKCHFYYGSKNSGPTTVLGNFSEVFSFSGDWPYCYFLCSFAICKVLRLSICCVSYFNDNICFGIGFTPADVPTNDKLLDTLNQMPPALDLWMMTKQVSKIALELYVTHGNLLVRGHIANGSRSIVHIELLELVFSPTSVIGGKKHLTNRTSLDCNQSTSKGSRISRSVGKSGRFSCSIEILNCLNVPLRNRNEWYWNSKDNDILTPEIPSFHRESFYGSGETYFEAMFSYEILSTDLALVIALKVGPGTNSFVAAFSQIPAVTGKTELEESMKPSQWKIHDYKKYSNARGESWEVIGDRNIRAEILMTEDENSILKIRIYAV